VNTTVLLPIWVRADGENMAQPSPQHIGQNTQIISWIVPYSKSILFATLSFQQSSKQCLKFPSYE